MSQHALTLVMGARSGIGRLVLDQLRAEGESVRASSRRAGDLAELAGPDVQTMSADLSEPESLQQAFRDVERAFVFAVPGSADGLLTAARRCGVRTLVLLSSGSVLLPSCADNPITAEHQETENELGQPEKPAVVPVRPLVLASNSLAWAREIRVSGTVTLYQPDALSAPIHEDDVAATVVAALRAESAPDREQVGRLLTGPRQLSQRDQVAAIGRAIGRDLTVVEQTREEALNRMSRFMPEVEADAILMFLDDCAAGNSPATEVAEAVLGRPPLPFEQWAVDHADDFR